MKRLLLLSAFLLLNLISISQTVPVTIINGSLKACDTNIVTATFTSIGQHKLNIKGELNFGSNTHVACGNSNGVLIEILSLKDSASGNLISFSPPVTDTVNGSVYISFDTLTTVVLTYRIHIDCSAIPTGANVDPIFVKQTWTDSISSVNYDLNASGVDSLLSAAILYPKLVYVPTVIDTIGYQESRILQFTFLNSGFNTANISFRFLEDATNYCGAFEDVDSLFYKINQGGTPLPYTNGAQAFIQLPVSDTLFIYRRIQAINCLDTCTHHAIFTWQCANRDSLGTAFCSSCFGSETINYVIQNRIMPQLKVIRAVPVSDQVTNFDVSCPNSLIGMRGWEFYITTENIGKLDLAEIHFTNYHSDSISSLGLIPQSTLQIDTLCSNCNFQMSYGQRDFALCADSVTNPIDNLKMVITNFGDGDTIKFRFQSFRCVEEDNRLYNVPKSFTNWTFRNTFSVSKCGLKDSLDFLYPAYTANGIVDQVAAVADLSLIYTPTVSDLSSPPNNFGDSADFEIKMNGLFIDDYDIVQQLLGCDASTANCIPTGYFKVTIECDPGLIVPNAQNYTRIKYKDSLGFINYYEPEYFYRDTSILGQCAAGSYVYYFNLNDSNALRMIKGGFFQFRLRSCCGGQNGAVKYKVLYDWLLNPSGSCNSLTFPLDHASPANCTGTDCKWLPLSFVEDDIVVHCPGCITPGIVVRSYRIERTSYGNKDSNDNGFADSPLTPIEYNSPSFLANRNDYGWYNSGIGDQLTDYLVAEFGAGDSGAGGYTYPMMQFQHSYLNHLQLDRIIGAGLDTMKVLPDTVLLYIDTPVSGAPDSCIDCGVFNVDSTKFVTQRVLKFFGSSLSKILFLDAVNNRYFFSFSSIDSSGHTGVLNGSDIIYNNTTYPYLGFFERQQYRLSVDYNVTGNFNLPRNYSGAVALDLIRKQSDVENRMWLSGDSLPSFAWNQSVKNPADIVELDSSGWYFPPDTTIGDTAVNQNFANQYMFNCENLDGIHYFYAHIYDVKSEASYVDDCTFKIQTSIFANVAARILDPYPFEYHPSNIQPRSYTFTVPTGYSTVGALLTNEIYGGGVSYRNQTASLTIDTNPTFTYYDNSFQIDPCFEEGDTTTGTKLYFGDIQTFKSIEILIASNNCDTSGFKIDSTTAVVSFEGDVDHCVDVNGVTLGFVDTLKSLQGAVLYNIRPNDMVSFTPSFDVQSNRICFTFSIENPFVTFGVDTFSTFAPNYFVVIPDTTTLNWLSNWTYHSSNGISYPINNQFFLSDTLLAINETHIGDSICASFLYCPVSITDTITFYSGWSCSDTLLQPFDTAMLCQFDSFSFIIVLDSANIGLSDGGARNRPLSEVYYTLCDTLFYECCFKSTQNDEVTLNNIGLPNFPDSLGVLDVSIRKGYCDSSSTEPWHSIVYDSLQNNWPISALDMDAIGYIDSVLKITEGISVRIAYMLDCHFEDTLPDVVLNANSYCNDPLSIIYDFNNTLKWDSTSNCQGCFALKKTSSVATVPAGDTLSFYIEICANNVDSGYVYLYDYLPVNFIAIDSIPWYFITPPFGCDTIVVRGYFSIPGSCNDNINIAKIKYAGFDSLNVYSGIDSLIDSSCVTVGAACIDSNTVIFLAGDFSRDYLSTYTNTDIYVEGLFTIDSYLNLVNCRVYTAAGAHIIVTIDALLDLDSTVIQGCDSMWQGITLIEDSKLNVRNNSCIQDAVIGAEMFDATQVLVEQSRIINSVIGVKVIGPTGGMFSGYLTISEATFGLFSSHFKPNYIGQPAHGVLPYAGIDMNDAVMVLGDGGATPPSYFYKMNKGIAGLRTQMEIVNCKFNGITEDNFYHTVSDGSAVASEGDLNYNPSYLQLMPVNYPDTTILNSYRGVYNEYSDLIVQYCTFNNVRTGVECSGNRFRQYAMVTDNVINATLYGALFYNNAGADYNIVAGNLIKVDGVNTGVGIAVREAKNSVSGNYDIAWNHSIRVVDGTAGIELLNAASPQVRCNLIKMDAGDEQAKSSTGITVLGCSSASITQNSVTGYTRANTSRMGLSCQVSTSCLIGCNSVDSTGYGFHFGSSNLFTNFRGNKMKSHLEGLHLNTTAVIDTQGHTGNQWLGNYSPWYGAVNMNAASQNLLASLFIVDPSFGGTFLPTTPTSNPVNNTGWFFLDTSSTIYGCPDETICYQSEYVGGEGSPSLLAMIALDSILSVDYIEESQSIAQLMLYDKLMRDTGLTGSDIVFQNFIINEPVLHNLYEARLSLQEYGEVQDSLAAVLLSMDSTILNFGDSIRHYLNLKMETQLNYDTIIAGFRASLNISRNIYASLIQQLRYENNGILVDAGFYNSLVDNLDELPLINENIMNDVEIGFEESGLEGIESYREQITEIAFQCPYQGGKGVFRARFFLSLFNDSVEYDDASVCLAQGILKISNPEKNIDPRLLIKPNPANNETEVFLTGIDFEKYQLKIISQDGRILNELNLKHSLSGNKISTSHLMPGVYFLEATIVGKSVCRGKLGIVR